MLKVTNKYHLAQIAKLNKVEQSLALAEINAELEDLTAEQRVKWLWRIFSLTLHCHLALGRRQR